ncbi:MAG: hypothetical protein MJY73_01370 [Bacteroidales bacterium]|nr:hypothetical protein [Bacteroidales bacterium]
MIKVRILTPEWSREISCDAVFLPGEMGEFEVLVNHAPIISTLLKGSVRWRTGEEMESLDIIGGVMRLKDNEMSICAEV